MRSRRDPDICRVIGIDPAGVAEQVGEVVKISPPKIVKAMKPATKPQAAKGLKGPRKRKF
jgi:hypothetical protein